MFLFRRHRGSAAFVLRSVSSSSSASSTSALADAVTSAAAASVAQPPYQEGWSDQQVYELLTKVCDLGLRSSSLKLAKEVAQLFNDVPDESVMRIITSPFAAPSSSSSSSSSQRGEVADPLVTIIDALIYVRSSGKLRSIVDYLRDDALLAHRVGARRLLHACETVALAALAAEAEAAGAGTGATGDGAATMDRERR